MTVQWSPVLYQMPHGSRGALKRYKVEYLEGTAPEATWKQCQDVIPNTSHILRNLEHYQEYRFCVRALYETLRGPISTLSDVAVTRPNLGK